MHGKQNTWPHGKVDVFVEVVKSSRQIMQSASRSARTCVCMTDVESRLAASEVSDPKKSQTLISDCIPTVTGQQRFLQSAAKRWKLIDIHTGCVPITFCGTGDEKYRGRGSEYIESTHSKHTPSRVHA
jgi:hypothetical protein